MSQTVVIGVGNRYRSDDGVGIEVVGLLRDLVPDEVEVVELDGEPTGLLMAWEGAGTAYVIDAVRADAPAGTVYRVELDGAGVPILADPPRRDSSHGLGVGEAVALAKAVDRLPERVVLIGIVGSSFEAGDAVTEAVHRAGLEVADAIAREIRSPI